MKSLLQLIIFLTLVAAFGCHGQNSNPDNNSAQDQATQVGGSCEGCDIMLVGMPSVINPTDTSAGWREEGQKFLLTGKVYQLDGKTPAGNVVLYYYHTDNKGLYSPKDGLDERARRHGHIRGWVRTDKNGNYSIYTIRPAPYPNGNIPAHIHIVVKEPDIQNGYYLDEFVFEDDPLVAVEKGEFQNRGGSGILKVKKTDDIQIAEHDITLGLNIPDYPKKR